MTKFDGYVEKIEKRRQAEKDRALDAWLLHSLRTRSKEEVLIEMQKILHLLPAVENHALFF